VLLTLALYSWFSPKDIKTTEEQKIKHEKQAPATVANDNVEYREYFEKYKYIILSQNIYNRVLSDKVVDNLHLYSKSGKLYFIDEKNSEIYKDKYRVLDFSAGLRLLFGLLKTNYHLFGFHYTSKSTFNWNKRHYFQIYNNITYQILHRWDVEKKIIGEILENK
jgi:hypothetical protein